MQHPRLKRPMQRGQFRSTPGCWQDQKPRTCGRKRMGRMGPARHGSRQKFRPTPAKRQNQQAQDPLSTPHDRAATVGSRRHVRNSTASPWHEPVPPRPDDARGAADWPGTTRAVLVFSYGAAPQIKPTILDKVRHRAGHRAELVIPTQLRLRKKPDSQCVPAGLESFREKHLGNQKYLGNLSQGSGLHAGPR